MNNTAGTVNGTETLLKNARLMTIINSRREQIDQLKHTIGHKVEMISQLERFPQQLIEEVEESIQFNMYEVREIAKENLQAIIESITDASEQKLNEQQRQKSELIALDIEVKIQEDVLKRSKQGHEKALSHIQQILKDVQTKLVEMRSEYPEN